MNLVKLDRILDDMSECYQYDTVSMIEHGELCWRWFYRIENAIGYWDPVPLPSWYDTYEKCIWDILIQLEYKDIRMYIEMHDCGKPYCRTVDESGKQHFPNHEQVSYEKWCEISNEPDGFIAQCILHDMDLHRIKPNQIKEFCKLPKEICCTLLISSLAEIYANADMFGGFDSTTFKIKWAQLDRRGKAICKELFGK